MTLIANIVDALRPIVVITQVLLFDTPSGISQAVSVTWSRLGHLSTGPRVPDNN